MPFHYDREPASVRYAERFPLSGNFLIDVRTKIEQKGYIASKEIAMTELLRDVAAFASICMFVASFSVLVIAL